jgi:hypothetical protein
MLGLQRVGNSVADIGTASWEHGRKIGGSVDLEPKARVATGIAYVVFFNIFVYQSIQNYEYVHLAISYFSSVMIPAG